MVNTTSTFIFSANNLEDEAADGFLPLEEEIRRSYFDGYDISTLKLTEKDLETLGCYLRKMLVVDPAQRATPQQLLAEAWVSEE